MKKLRRVQAVSLAAAGLAALVCAGSQLLPGLLPDFALRLAGVVSLAAAPALVYATVRTLLA